MKPVSILLVLFILGRFYSHAQVTKIVIEVFDSKTNLPVHYAEFWFSNHNYFAYSDKNGRIVYNFNENEYNVIRDDTVNIYSISYQKITFAVKEILNGKYIKILLVPDPIVLPTHIVKPAEISKNKKYGKKSRPLRIGKSTATVGCQYGNYFENEMKKEGKIRSVQVYITDRGCYNAPFRLRIYSVNSKKCRKMIC